MAHRLWSGFWLSPLLLTLGCGASQARVHGQLLEKPGVNFTLHENEQAMMTLYRLGPDGKPDPLQFYSATVKPDGSFDVQVADGQIPPGKYRVALTVTPMTAPGGGRPQLVDRLNGRFSRDGSPLDVELKPGANDVPLDLSAKSAS